MSDYETVSILGIPIHRVTMQEALQKVDSLVEEGQFSSIFTPNAEIVMMARNDSRLREILLSADLLVPDGIGVVWASRIVGVPFSERVAGFDLMVNLLSLSPQKGYKIYLLGGSPGIAEKASRNIKSMQQGIKIVGSHHGYLRDVNQEALIKDIKDKAPDILFVAMGAPLQERWIDSVRQEIGGLVCIGVGGSLDVLAGEVKRAPIFFRRLGLEWLYRLLSQPRRVFRMFALPKFVLIVIKEKILSLLGR